MLIVIEAWGTVAFKSKIHLFSKQSNFCHLLGVDVYDLGHERWPDSFYDYVWRPQGDPAVPQDFPFLCL